MAVSYKKLLHLMIERDITTDKIMSILAEVTGGKVIRFINMDFAI